MGFQLQLPETWPEECLPRALVAAVLPARLELQRAPRHPRLRCAENRGEECRCFLVLPWVRPFSWDNFYHTSRLGASEKQNPTLAARRLPGRRVRRGPG